MPESPFAIVDFKFRLWPLPVVLALGAALAVAGVMATSAMVALVPPPWNAQSWLSVTVLELFFLAFALIGIAIASRAVRGFDSALRWPPGRSYVGAALLIGCAFGLIMLVADYWPQFVQGQPPDAPYEMTPVGAAGWLGFELLLSGPAEETMFRGLLLGLLVLWLPGRLRVFRFEVSVAGVLIALLFSLAHISSFWESPLSLALGQQIYAVALGILYAWLRERSQSLLAPMIAHSVSNFVEVGLVYLLA